VKTRSLEQFSSVRTEGGLLPPDVLKRIADGDAELGGLGPREYHLAGAERLTEAISHSWNRLVGAWQTFRSAAEKLPERDAGTSLTRERWLLILFQELGYGRLPTAKATEIDGRTYPISHFWQRAPIHLVAFRADLDRRTRGVAGAARRSPHSLVQEFLNRSDEHLWGFVSNGHTLRVLRDNASLTRLAYVEFDLEAMMEGEVYSDFALLWLLCHQSRVDAEVPEDSWLERWTKAAREQGTRALDSLRDGVERAIVVLGRGFLANSGNGDLRGRLREGTLDTQDYYRQLLRLVYRLLFLFVAEDRELLFAPAASSDAKERYNLYYSTRRLRGIAGQRRGTRHSDLYAALRLVMAKLGDDAGCPELGLPALGSFLWSRDALADVGEAEIANLDLLEAVRALAFIQQESALRAVDYRNLGSAELGSVYESLLELHPTMNVDAASFALETASGHERKTTGSYYTDESLVQCLLDSALDPVLDEAARKADPERAILDLKVCDPAVGSGHFLVAAAHRMARRLAAVRTGEEEPSAEATRTALRDVIGHCLYGVDVNPMAVELCKVSLWMEALDPGKPLSFLDHHIRVGNSLLGTTAELIAGGLPDDAFKPIKGDDKTICSALKKRNKQEREGAQQDMIHLMVAEPQAEYNTIANRTRVIDQAPDETIDQIRDKTAHFRRLVASPEYRHAQQVADAWCAAFVWPKKAGVLGEPLTTDTLRRLEADPQALSRGQRAELERLARKYQFFHWEVAFPEILAKGGFDCVLGNPPFVNAIEGSVEKAVKKLLSSSTQRLSGTADLAYYFVDLADRIVVATGPVGLVQPKGFLNADSASVLRTALLRDRGPRMLYIPVGGGFFKGVSAYICLITLRHQGECVVSDAPAPDLADWQGGEVTEANWWRVAQQILGKIGTVTSTERALLEDHFDIVASMTTGEAYAIKPFIVDQQKSQYLRLITTGLIDPGICLWGKKTCRYLGRSYSFPTLGWDSGMQRSVLRRLEMARRPKLLIAGLCNRLEAFIDMEATCIGTVSTFSVFHPQDDVGALCRLCEWFNSEEATDQVRAELGAASVGGGYMTLKKRTIQRLRIPETIIT
jgi:type I restriction-modification system DNA methylase subunit